jgi:ATP-dependent Clp protease ATP-binding subunit ClpC
MTPPPDLAEFEARIEKLQLEKDEAVRNADYERAAALRDDIQRILDEKAEIQRQWQEKNDEVIGEVDIEVVAEVVSKMTGIPLTRLEKEEAQKLLERKPNAQECISQVEAINAIPRPSAAPPGLKDPNRPMGSFIFIGPSGVGRPCWPVPSLNSCLAMPMR